MPSKPVRPALAGALSLALAAAAQAGPAEVDDARLLKADQDTADWLSYGRTYGEERFSPLAEITADNAGQLGLGWYADLDSSRGQEATPLEIDGTLYVSTAWSMVKAYDAKTGRLKWSYDPAVLKSWDAKACCDAVNRGVAAWRGRIYVGTLDGRLVALDAATGKPVWSVVTVDPSRPYAITMAPRIYGGRVVIGNSGGEFGVRGYVSAYDAETGTLDWRFFTVPGDPAKPFENAAMARAAKTWSGEWWKLGGGGTVWDSVSYDPALGLVYIGTGNGVEWNQGARSRGTGDNLYLSSIIALKADTGAYVWHYQTTPGEEWDYDATQQMVLAELTIAGQPRKVLMQANKNGFFYVLDRKTGALVSAAPFAAQSWAKGIDAKTGRPIPNPAARYDATGKPASVTPGPIGAHSWQPMAFNPASGLVYIPTNEMSFPFVPDRDYRPAPVGFNLALDMAAASLPADPKIQAAALAGETGFLLAWDPVAQREVWRAPQPGPCNGGALATAGNLVLEGNAAGELAAFRADNGRKLWSMSAQSAVMAAPMSYAVDGEQYVAVLSGWGGAFALSPGRLSAKSGNLRNISRLLVFKLGGSARLPPLPPETVAVLDPPPATADAATVAQGKALFSRYCGVCHGDAAISGGVTPDLRHSAFLKDDGFYDIVLKGALKDAGMVSFASVLDRDKAAAIRAYLIQRANEDKATEAAAKP